MDRPSGMSSSKRDPSDEESDEDDDDEDDEDAINFKQEDMIVSIEKTKINLKFLWFSSNQSQIRENGKGRMWADFNDIWKIFEETLPLHKSNEKTNKKILENFPKF